MPTYTEAEINALLDKAKKAGLKAPSEFWETPASELVKVCNGIGADWQSKKTRRIITKALKYAEPAALIHDWRYSRADASKSTQQSADREFLLNGLIYVHCVFPQWWNWRRWLGERAMLALYAVLQRVGWVAYCLSFVERINKTKDE